MTDELLKKVSEDERLREARWDRERYELDHALRETEALERGLEQGLKQGRSEGKRALKENQREIALKMKRIGMTFNEICQCTGLSKEEIEAL